jgi:UDPglucose 6-dehydrogenase
LKVAIIGAGFVGTAVGRAFDSNNCLFIDPKLGTRIEDLISFEPDYTFVCVPTPSKDDGSVDLSIVESVTRFALQNTYSIVIVKSTVPPSFADRFRKNDRVVFNPEFLTERNAVQDMIESENVILGGAYPTTKKVERLYKLNSACAPSRYVHVSAEEACWIKYATNSFLAVKVAYLNELRDNFADSQSWNRVVNALRLDTRLGTSHWLVPGLDGKRGFGGACLPKDSSALLHEAKNMSILNSAIEKNNLYRSLYEPDARELSQNIKFGEDN